MMKRPAYTILLPGFIAAGLALSGWLAIRAASGLTHATPADSVRSSATATSHVSLESIALVPNQLTPNQLTPNQSTYTAPTVGQPLRTEGGGTR